MILNNCRLIPQLSGGVASDCGSVCIEDGKIVRVSAATAAAKRCCRDSSTCIHILRFWAGLALIASTIR